MTDAEAAIFLRKYLDDFERYARFVQESFRGTPSDPGEGASPDALSLRRLPVVALLRAAGVPMIPPLDPGRVDSKTMASNRATLLHAIGAFEHGMVGLQPDRSERTPVEPEAPASRPVRTVTADDLPEMSLAVLIRTLKVRGSMTVLGIISAILAAGAGAGFLWGRAVEKKEQELAVERVTRERDTCRQEIASSQAPARAEPPSGSQAAPSLVTPPAVGPGSRAPAGEPGAARQRLDLGQPAPGLRTPGVATLTQQGVSVVQNSITASPWSVVEPGCGTVVGTFYDGPPGPRPARTCHVRAQYEVVEVFCPACSAADPCAPCEPVSRRPIGG